MSAHALKATHKPLHTYYEALKTYVGQGISHEMAVRSAFQNLLAETSKPHGWALIPELKLKVGGKYVRPDGTLRDQWQLPRAYWEAKDTHDDLETEIRAKIAKGYPLSNTIFEDTRRAILFQGGREVFRAELDDPQQLADLLNQLYGYTEPDIEGFDRAVAEFQERIPDLARGLLEKIQAAHRDIPEFIGAFEEFFEICQTSLNPNISVAAVDEMLVQHLLTERLFRTIFNNPDFTRRLIVRSICGVFAA